MNLIQKLTQPKKKKEIKPAPVPKKKDDSPAAKKEEIMSAIAAAIFLYRQEVHDIENTVLTIKRIDRMYSPWSSKIYGLRRSPR